MIRDSGIVLLTRIAGLLLSAIAVQLVANSVLGVHRRGALTDPVDSGAAGRPWGLPLAA